jgi:hypothetical protein
MPFFTSLCKNISIITLITLSDKNDPFNPADGDFQVFDSEFGASGHTKPSFNVAGPGYPFQFPSPPTMGGPAPTADAGLAELPFLSLAYAPRTEHFTRSSLNIKFILNSLKELVCRDFDYPALPLTDRTCLTADDMVLPICELTRDLIMESPNTQARR